MYEIEDEAEDPFTEDRSDTTPEQDTPYDADTTSDNTSTDADTGTRSAAAPSTLTHTTERVNTNDAVTPTRVAHVLRDDEYETSNPPVPYAVWRDSVERNRAKTTINVNKTVIDSLARRVQRQFNAEFDTTISVTDVRELALAYGLTQTDALFDMATEWGIQYETPR